MGSQKYTDEIIEKTLLGDGQSLGDYFIAEGTISLWPKQGEQTLCSFEFFEGVEFGTACLEYLRSHGVAEYRTFEEALKARNAGLN
jgi:hypothetical protein